jgi:hypothetical protein
LIHDLSLGRFSSVRDRDGFPTIGTGVTAAVLRCVESNYEVTFNAGGQHRTRHEEGERRDVKEKGKKVEIGGYNSLVFPTSS